jgi:hypothetical protein
LTKLSESYDEIFSDPYFCVEGGFCFGVVEMKDWCLTRGVQQHRLETVGVLDQEERRVLAQVRPQRLCKPEKNDVIITKHDTYGVHAKRPGAAQN